MRGYLIWIIGAILIRPENDRIGGLFEGRFRMKKYAVDFELAGTVIVRAGNRDEAIEKAQNTRTTKLIDLVENANFGRHYVEEE
jgi:hypothetical protein